MKNINHKITEPENKKHIKTSNLACARPYHVVPNAGATEAKRPTPNARPDAGFIFTP